METLPKTQNTFLAYLLILIAFFIILFFTRNIFAELQVSLDTKEQLAQDISEKEKTLAGLNDIQTKLSQEGSTELQEIQGFLGSFSDADILEYIYSYAQKINLGSERIIIRDITLSEQGQSDIGFHTAQIQISALFSSEATLLAFTDFLTAKNGKYQFYLTTFEYPMNNVSGNIQVSIPLTLYYKK